MLKMPWIPFVVAALFLVVSCGNGGTDAPKNLTAVAGTASVKLSWDTVDSGTETTEYNVYRGTATGSLGSKTKLVSSLTDAAYTDTTVAVNSTYYYQVTAENSKGESGGSNEAEVTVGTLAAPTNLTASIGINKVTLSWDAVSGATGYNIYRGTTKTGSISGKTKIGTDVSSTSYTDGTVTPGVTYYYQVTAADGSVESGGSAEIEVTP